MNNKLEVIYKFLKDNKSYNHELQQQEYYSTFSYHNGINDKVLSLLYNIANSQSQPKIDYLAEFFQFIHEDMESLGTFQGFIKRLTGKENGCYHDLFEGLRNRNGWGDKTSALFTKVIFNVHNGKFDKSLRIWGDAPNIISASDKLFLPVDAVIIKIFKHLGCKKHSFSSINKEIRKYSNGESIVLWDDLWFWGFITQKGSGESRTIEWNPNKYWSLEHSDKSLNVINCIKQKSEHFIALLNEAKIK